MKTKTATALTLAMVVGLCSTTVAGLSYSYSGPAVAIPDNDASGRAFAFSLSDSATAITSVSVTFDISGGYNGDLYAYLSHGSGFAVLLNRVGVGAGTSGSSATGYSGTGFALTLSSAGSANAHFYQNSSPSFNGGGQLTGTWQPDARAIDPGSTPSAFDASGAATFSSFTGLNPNGDWILYFADVSAINESTLDSFSVGITAVPEPVNVALGVFGGLLAVVGLCRSTRARSAFQKASRSP